MTTRCRLFAVTASVAFGVMLNTAGAEDIAPRDWLNRMASAVQSTSYEGTVIRLRNGKAEALKVAHQNTDGVIREKVIVQEGNGLEIIRNGNEVQCILPDKKSVLVEEWNDQSTLFSTLPSSNIRFGSEYDVAIVRKGRIAGRKAILLAIRPHDEYRFGHRIWLDIATAFPLQTTLVGTDGATIEQVKFADIALDKEIHAAALAPSISIENFRFIAHPRPSVTREVDSPWSATSLPNGFRVVSSHAEELPGREQPVIHILFSDGLATVSVFIEPVNDTKLARRSQVGASSSFSIEIDGFRVTAVGEVPAATVEQIATSMQPN